MVVIKGSMGTTPFGRQPPLIRQPMAPFCCSLLQRSNSFLGVVAGCMFVNRCPAQCLQFKAQLDPVMEIAGKKFVF